MYTNKRIDIIGTQDNLRQAISDVLINNFSDIFQIYSPSSTSDVFNSGYPFTYSIFGIPALKITAFYSSPRNYTDIFIKGANTSDSVKPEFCSYNVSDQAGNDRSMYIRIITNEKNFVYIDFDNYNGSVDNRCGYMYFIKYSDDLLFCYSNNGDSVYSCVLNSDTSVSTSFMLYNALNFSNQDDIVIYYHDKISTINSVLYQTLPGILDCSTVAPNKVYRINNEKYFAIDEHTLIKLGNKI